MPKQYIHFVDYGVEYRSEKPQLESVVEVAVQRLEAKGITNAYTVTDPEAEPEISGGEHDVVKDAIHEHIFGE